MTNQLLTKFFPALVSAIIFFSACNEIPSDFLLPQWDTELNIPIANRHFTMEDLIDEQGYLSTSGLTVENGIYVVESETYNLNTDLSEFVKLSGFTSITDLPVQTDSQDVTLYLQFPNGTELDSASFLSGALDFSVNNPTGNEVAINISIPGICDSQGEELNIEIITPAYSTNSILKNLNQHSYTVPDNQPSEFKNSLMVSTIANNGQETSDAVLLDISSTEFRFNYVVGKMPSTSLGVRRNSFEFASDVDDYRDKMTIRDAELNLDANLITQLSDPYPVDVRNLNIIGMRSDGQEFYLRDESENENLSFQIENGSIQHTFNNENSNISELISFLPDSVLLRAEYIINPGNERGSAASSDSVSFNTSLKVQSFVAINRSTVVDSSEIELAQDQKDAIADGNSLSIVIDLENAIPLSGWFKIDMVDEFNNKLFTISNNSNNADSLYFEGASVDGEGEVTNSVVTPTVAVELNSEQIDMLTRTTHAVYSVTLETSESSSTDGTVAIRPTDWIKIRAFGKINYRVKP
ncbi:MAG: hypothetical protein PVF17_03275 [Ignavibacteria bacterium]